MLLVIEGVTTAKDPHAPSHFCACGKPDVGRHHCSRYRLDHHETEGQVVGLSEAKLPDGVGLSLSSKKMVLPLWTAHVT
jgi:hypothetical protein